MVRILITLVAVIFWFSGCSLKNETEKQSNESNRIDVKKETITKDDERRLFYRGDYDINYKPPRVVWFKPLLTEKGNILSERTITLAPKDIKWTNEHNMKVGEKFKELVGEK
ncbi:hypothetical protein ACNSOL_11995 (plasmid) [Aliarcobacter lanthieri]|uniref:hypothetical protein n=1 Tax=Aliarcobacter lanthieri TaxID=1355374 RepID=UPI003AAD99E1